MYFKLGILMMLFFVTVEKAVTQNNLIPNWSFEEHKDTCNYSCLGTGFMNTNIWYPRNLYSSHEYDTYLTPDYYSSCIVDTMSIYSCEVPSNTIGVQYPYHGNAYAGMLFGIQNIFVSREAIRIQLTEPLKSNTCYHGEFYYSLADNSFRKCNKFGLVVTVDSFAMVSYDNGPYPAPQIYDPNVNGDTLNWKKIEGEFYADGGEQWLTMGYFFPKEEIQYDTIAYTPTEHFAYYYVDAIRLYACSDDEETIVLPNFISPNGDGQNDFYVIDSLPANTKASFFNRWGNQVYHSDNYQNNWDGMYMGHLLPSGTYFVVIEMPYGTKKSAFVELMY